MRLYLASQSARRAQLLDQLGICHEPLLADAEEDAESLEEVMSGESPTAYVRRVTMLKLRAALARRERRGLPPAPVLCADTTVALGHRILGKPVDAADACVMLGFLSGSRHRVLTAVAVGVPEVQHMALSTSWVRFAELAPTWIRDYVASGEPIGKAGAYAIQGRAAAVIADIRGSYSGIMGLPLFETAQLLRAFRFSI